jgi:hypothetical protein
MEQMLVMINIKTATDEADPIFPWALLNFIYIKTLLVKMDELGDPLPSVSR